MAKATPRPWKWEWTATNVITIYHTDGSYVPQDVADIHCDSKDAEVRAQCEADALMICTAANTHDEMRHPNE
jgi:hypothetical protein